MFEPYCRANRALRPTKWIRDVAVSSMVRRERPRRRWPRFVAAVAAVLAIVLLAVLSVKQWSGVKMLALYTVLYGVFRFVLEFFRGDAHRGLLWGFSTSQYIAVFTVVLVAVTALWRKKRFAKTPHNKNS